MVDAEDFDQELEKMKAKGLAVIESGIFQAEISSIDKVMSYEHVYFDTRKAGGFAIELMQETAPGESWRANDVDPDKVL